MAGFGQDKGRRGLRSLTGADLRVFQIISETEPPEDFQWINIDQVMHFDFRPVAGGNFVLEFFFPKGASVISEEITAANVQKVADRLKRFLQRPGGEANIIS